jgi:DnaB-like helicase C terminal domain
MRNKTDIQLIAETDDIAEVLEGAADVLASCIVSCNYDYHRIAAKISPEMTACLNPVRPRRKIIEAAMKMWSDDRKYNTFGITNLTGLPIADVSAYGQRHTDTDLEMAFDHFFTAYERYKELQISITSQDMLRMGKFADEIRDWQDKYRRDMGLYAMAQQSDGREVFEKMLLDAYAGREPDFPVKPFLPAMRKWMPYFDPEDYVVVAGRSGMGKSYYALNQLYWCAENNVPATYINLEMSEPLVFERLWQMRSGIHFKTDMSKITDDERVKGMVAWEWLKKCPINVVSPGRKLSGVVAAMRQSKYEHNTNLFVIDYVQMMTDSQKGGIKTYELENIIYTTKEEGKMLKTPVMAMAQLLRTVDNAINGKRPTNADLKDTAALENAATVIKMLYRPGYYGITEDGEGRVYDDLYADIEITKGRRYGKSRTECSFDHIRGFYPAEDQPFPLPQTPPPRNTMNEEDIPF